MSMKKYFITLKPTGAFYFGSEQNFGSGENYFAVSRQVPQQSTLLGVLRYKLLEANGLLAKDHGKALNGSASKKIGLQSFVHNKISEAKDYGVINHITSVSLFDGEKFYFRGHLDNGLGCKDDKEENHDFQLELNNGYPLLRNYDTKAYYPAVWVGKDGKAIKEDELFTPKTQVGIYRTVSRLSKRQNDVREDEEEKGFFKKTSWVLKNPKLAFGFFAFLATEDGDKLKDFCQGGSALTPVGGERSLFEMHVSDSDELYTQWQKEAAKAMSKNSQYNRAVLLSDAYLKPEEIYKNCVFSLAKPVPFRFMMSSFSGTKNYFALEDARSKGRQYLRKSPLFQLMEAGSVFYLTDEQLAGFEDVVQESVAYRQIGNNDFILFKKDNTVLYQPYKSENNG